MEHAYIITIDNGTSSTKTALWTDDGQLVVETAQAYALNRPDPVWADIDADVWWQAVCDTIHGVVAKAGINPRQVAAVGVDGISFQRLHPQSRQLGPKAHGVAILNESAAMERGGNSIPALPFCTLTVLNGWLRTVPGCS